MAALANKIGNDPVLLSLLDIFNSQRGQFGATQTASQENGERGVVPLAPKTGNVYRPKKALTGAPDFAERTAALASGVLSQGPVSVVSCAGVGSGSMRWSEEELQRLEVGVVGAFARGCHDAGIAQFCLLSAAGSTTRRRFRYVRVMGMKEDTVGNVGFARLAIFRPGIIVGNAHTSAWVVWQY